MKFKSKKELSIAIISLIIFIFILSCLESCSNSAIFIFTTIGASAVCSFGSYLVIRKRQKEQQIKKLLTKVSNTVTFYDPPSSTENYFIYQDNSDEIIESCPLVYNLIETPESPVEEVVESKRVIEESPKNNVSETNFVLLFRIFCRLNEAFPLLKQKFLEIGIVNFVMGLKDLPEEEIPAFISNLLEDVSSNEIITQISIVMNEMLNSRKHKNWKPVLHKISELIYLAESKENRRLMNDLLSVLIFIKYSPQPYN